jgi:cytoskeletal protein RodZ
MVVAIGALAGAAIGWRFPFLGQNRATNQLATPRQNTVVQPVNRTRVQNTRQQVAQAPNNSTSAQSPNAGTSPSATTSEGTQGDTNPGVPALW